jgi:hypothetical protein
MAESTEQIAIILFHRILPLIGEKALRTAERRLGSVLRYPDGTLQFDCPDAIAAENASRDIGLFQFLFDQTISSTLSRNLAAFPEQCYSFYYGGDYQRRLGEDEFIAGRGSGMKHWPGEYRLEDILFTIWFRRRPSNDVRAALAGEIGAWLASVAEAGLWSEGPVLPIVPHMQFRGKRADIRLDASRSGPHTLMYLILTALEFGHRVAPVGSAVFNYDDPLARQTMIECIRNATMFTGVKFDKEDERKWLEQELGGPGPMLELPLVPPAGK